MGVLQQPIEQMPVGNCRALGRGHRIIVIGVYASGRSWWGSSSEHSILKVALQKQLAVALAILAVTAWPLLVADTVLLLAFCAVLVSGVAISPTFITAFGLIERRVPANMLTEGVTWVMTGIGIGMALGRVCVGLGGGYLRAAERLLGLGRRRRAALVTVLLGQKVLGDGGERVTPAVARPRPAE